MRVLRDSAITLAAGLAVALFTVVIPQRSLPITLLAAILAMVVMALLLTAFEHRVWLRTRVWHRRRVQPQSVGDPEPTVVVDQPRATVRLLVTHPENLAPAEYELQVRDVAGVEMTALLLPWHVRWVGSDQPRVQVLPGQEAVLELLTFDQERAQDILYGHHHGNAYIFHSPTKDYGADIPLRARTWDDIGPICITVGLYRVSPPFHCDYAIQTGFRVVPTIHEGVCPEDGIRAYVHKEQTRNRAIQDAKASVHQLVKKRFAALVSDDEVQLRVLAWAAIFTLEAPMFQWSYPIQGEDGEAVLQFQKGWTGAQIRADGYLNTLEEIARLHAELVREARRWDAWYDR